MLTSVPENAHHQEGEDDDRDPAATVVAHWCLAVARQCRAIDGQLSTADRPERPLTRVFHRPEQGVTPRQTPRGDPFFVSVPHNSTATITAVCPSGRRGLTVNQVYSPPEVRILLLPPVFPIHVAQWKSGTLRRCRPVVRLHPWIRNPIPRSPIGRGTGPRFRQVRVRISSREPSFRARVGRECP